MPTVAESSAARHGIAAQLRAGVDLLSENQTVTFTLYRKVVLPLDGWVFWVNASLLGPSAIYDWSPIGTYTHDQPPTQGPPTTLVVRGSLHISAVQQQSEDESFAINQVTFTSETMVEDFNAIGPNTKYIGTFDPGFFGETPVRFAFSRRDNYYKAARLWHYVGDVIYPVMEDMIIDNVADFDTKDLIVSNSLPFWLALQPYFLQNYGINLPMYPSFLVNDEIDPPYAAVHIPPEETQSIQPVPWSDLNGSHWQLAKDRVTITTYRLRNFNMMDIYDAILAAIGVTGDPVGLMNGPIVRDEKRTQSELNVLAIKKSITFEVSYYQQRIRDVAIQYIKRVIVNYAIENPKGPLIVINGV